VECSSETRYLLKGPDFGDELETKGICPVSVAFLVEKFCAEKSPTQELFRCQGTNSVNVKKRAKAGSGIELVMRFGPLSQEKDRKKTTPEP
jgi:hypothetical protein